MALSIWTGEKADRKEPMATPNDRIRKLTEDAHALALVLGATRDEADSLVNGMKASYQAFIREQARQERADALVKDMVRSMVDHPEVLVGVSMKKFEEICRAMAQGLLDRGWIFKPPADSEGLDQHGLKVMPHV